MKYLTNYIEDAQTRCFNKAGAFFAFSNRQFDEAKKEGVEYFNMGAGLICPKVSADSLLRNLKSINKKGIKQDIKENGIKAIIHRELANHECQITMDITDCVNKLVDYPITREDIQAEWDEYFHECIGNDRF